MWQEQLFLLVAAHALTDYALQPEWMAQHKSPLNPPPEKLGQWWWVLTAHGLINGLGVALILGVWWLGVAETVAHFTIDRAKCLKRLTAKQDQILHLLSKILWVCLAQ